MITCFFLRITAHFYLYLRSGAPAPFTCAPRPQFEFPIIHGHCCNCIFPATGGSKFLSVQNKFFKGGARGNNNNHKVIPSAFSRHMRR